MDLRDKNGLTEEEFLNRYDTGNYKRPSVATDIVIFTVMDKKEENYRKLPKKEFQVLLIKRGGHPFLGRWALPGGFVHFMETTEQAARRELIEETAVSNVYLEQLYTFSDPKRDPRTWVMSCSYMALIDYYKVQIKAGDDADNAAWFKVSYYLIKENKTKIEKGWKKIFQYKLELINEQEKLEAIIEYRIEKKDGFLEKEYKILFNKGLAFDHAKIIAYAIERLRRKIEYTSIALNLMPEKFTLTQLQQVYEIILNKQLLKAAFRRKIAHLVKETNEYTESAGHRPSRLYKRKMDIEEF